MGFALLLKNIFDRIKYVVDQEGSFIVAMSHDWDKKQIALTKIEIITSWMHGNLVPNMVTFDLENFLHKVCERHDKFVLKGSFENKPETFDLAVDLLLDKVSFKDLIHAPFTIKIPEERTKNIEEAIEYMEDFFSINVPYLLSCSLAHNIPVCPNIEVIIKKY